MNDGVSPGIHDILHALAVAFKGLLVGGDFRLRGFRRGVRTRAPDRQQGSPIARPTVFQGDFVLSCIVTFRMWSNWVVHNTVTMASHGFANASGSPARHAACQFT